MNRLRISLLIVLFSLVSFRAAAVRQQTIDSLKLLIENGPDDTTKVNRLYLLGRYYDYFNSKERITYFAEALNLARALDFKPGIKSVSAGITTNLFHRNMYDLAIRYCHEYMAFLEDEGETAELRKTYNLYANLLTRQEKYDEAQRYYNLALAFHRGAGDVKQQAIVLNNLQILMMAQGKTDSAAYYGNEAINLQRRLNDPSPLANSLVGMANITLKKGDISQAEIHAREALNMYTLINIPQGISNAEAMIAEIFFEKQQYDSALTHFTESLNRIIPLNLYSQRSELCLRISECYAKQGRYNDAYTSQLLFKQYADSATLQERKSKMLEIEVKYDIARKENELQLQKEQLSAGARQQKLLIAGIAAVLLLLIVSVRAFLLKKKTNRLISAQKKLVEEKQAEVLDSIRYAHRIQQALLAHDSLIAENLSDYFCFYKPKDIVSGDFYWATKNENGFYLAVCDSTGHGVPGAFMSLLNSTFLNEAITEKHLAEPDAVLNYVRKRLTESLSKDEQKDGMDGTLIRFGATKMYWASAYNGFVLVRNNELLEMQADRMPVGKDENEKPFTLFETNIQPGDVIYVFTDGFADQFGGPKGKKFKYKQLHDLLLQNHRMPMQEQLAALEKTLEAWQGGLEQVDDILVMGIRIT